MSNNLKSKAHNAVRVLLEWMGEDPDREGLKDTPRRVADMFKEQCSGYNKDYKELFKRTFSEINQYDEIIVLRDISFESLCEHHLAPIIGKVHIAYLPNKKIIGISKLARLVDILSKRLQVQERLTADLAKIINDELKPKGVAVIVEAIHHCMTTRGVHKPGVSMVSSKMNGIFLKDTRTRKEFLSLIHKS